MSAPTYSLFPAPNYDVYTLRVCNEELCMELCRNGEGIPFVRLPGFQKAVPAGLINKENTFRLSSGIALNVLTEPFDKKDLKFTSISYAELLTLMRGGNALISFSTMDVMLKLYANDSLREKLELPAVGEHPGFDKHIADCDVLEMRLDLEKSISDKQ